MSLSLRFLWLAAGRLRDELLPMAGANLAWFLLTLPLFGLLLYVVLFAFKAQTASATPSLLPLLAAGFLALVLPTPAATGLYHLARATVKGEAASLAAYRAGLARSWRQGLVMFMIGLGGLVLAGANIAFYFTRGGLWVALAVVWADLAMLWLLLQPHLLPLLVAFPSDSLWRRYRRAAGLAAGTPLVSLALLGAAGLVTLGGLLAPPLYALLAMAFLALSSTHALADAQQRHGSAGGAAWS